MSLSAFLGTFPSFIYEVNWSSKMLNLEGIGESRGVVYVCSHKREFFFLSFPSHLITLRLTTYSKSVVLKWMFIRPGVPWNIHCWSQTVGHAFERGQKSFLTCLLRDFQSMSADEYTNGFCEDGLVILFNIFKECEVTCVSWFSYKKKLRLLGIAININLSPNHVIWDKLSSQL